MNCKKNVESCLRVLHHHVLKKMLADKNCEDKVGALLSRIREEFYCVVEVRL